MKRCGMFAAAVLSGLWLSLAGFDGMQTEVRAAVEQPFSAYYAYTDPRTGEEFFNVYRGGERFVVFRSADGEWMRLPEAVHAIGSGGGEGCAGVSAPGLMRMPIYDLGYDAAADELVHTAVYTHSPSGKWGLKFVSLLGYMDGEQPAPKDDGHVLYGTRNVPARHGILVKDSARGVVRLIYAGSGYRRFEWLPDGTLLVQQLSETERQNELVRIDPATGETKRLMLGTLRSFNRDLGLLLYVKNEPSRTLRIYDFRTGQSRIAQEGEADALFYDVIKQERLKEPSVPRDLDLDALPVAEAGERQRHGAVLALNGDEAIPLPYAFIGLDGGTYVPLRPLVERGWTLVREVSPGGGHEYVLETDRGGIRLNPGNSIAVDGHLFIGISLIRSLGLEAELEWIR